MTSRKVPLLPGFVFNDSEKLLSDNHSKAHIFDVSHNTHVVKDLKRSVAPGGKLEKKVEDLVAEYYKRPKTEDLGHKPPPRFVLRFFVFFKEGVSESQTEKFRVRKCILYYFLEDGTLQICEPREDNSCLTQGTLVKRHLVFNEEQKKNFTHMDLAPLGNSVLIYGKRFKVVGCDKFTRDFYTKLGVDVGEELEYPLDDYRKKKAKGKKGVVKMTQSDWELKRFLEHSFKGRRCNLTKEEKYLSKQFFKNSGKVLQFFSVWDDRTRLNGDYRYFVVQYFLANDCIKVSERLPANSGRENFPVFIRKSLIKHPTENRNYNWADFRVGAPVTIFSKNFFLYDCDAFTRKYYEEVRMPQPEKMDMGLKAKESVKIVPPPHNGFGTEEDTLNSWKYLFMKPVKKDVQRLISYDKVSLRFAARMLRGGRVVEGRKFVVNFHLADNTVSVFEPEERNSGIRGGKFIERRKLKNPATGKNFDEVDCFVGAALNINEFQFLLYDTDERTLTFMEKNKDTFLRSNVEYILHKIKSRNPDLTPLAGVVMVKAFGEVIRPLLDCDHELRTLLRRYGVSGGVDCDKFKQAYEAAYDLFEEKRKLNEEKKLNSQSQEVKANEIFDAFCEDYLERPFLFKQLFKAAIDLVNNGRLSEKQVADVIENGLIPRKIARMTVDEIPLLNSVIFKHQKLLDLHEFVRILRVKH